MMGGGESKSDVLGMSKFLKEYLRTDIPKACYTFSFKIIQLNTNTIIVLWGKKER